jgi:hypothetical protein
LVLPRTSTAPLCSRARTILTHAFRGDFPESSSPLSSTLKPVATAWCRGGARPERVDAGERVRCVDRPSETLDLGTRAHRSALSSAQDTAK